MKTLKAFTISLVICFSGLTLESLLIFFIGPIVGILYFFFWQGGDKATETVFEAVKSAREVGRSIGEKLEQTKGEEDFDLYAKAEQEVVNGTQNPGLWSKALLEADGKEDQRKVMYIRLRAKQLKAEKPTII